MVRTILTAGVLVALASPVLAEEQIPEVKYDKPNVMVVRIPAGQETQQYPDSDGEQLPVQLPIQQGDQVQQAYLIPLRQQLQLNQQGDVDIQQMVQQADHQIQQAEQVPIQANKYDQTQVPAPVQDAWQQADQFERILSWRFWSPWTRLSGLGFYGYGHYPYYGYYAYYPSYYPTWGYYYNGYTYPYTWAHYRYHNGNYWNYYYYW